MRRMLGGSRTVPPGVLTHAPFVQVPLQGRLQPPQWSLSLITSMHALPHSIWPAAEQPQTPPLHTDPAGHALPQAPQLSAFVMTFTHAPPAHAVSSPAQLDWQELLLHTCAPAHALVQVPQWLASEDTQVPLQASRPALHWHWPAWQV